MHRRLSLTQLATRRRAIVDARAWGTDILSAADLLRYWGRNTYRDRRPAGVYRRREARRQRAWVELQARLDVRPIPQPPPGRIFGFSNGAEYDAFTCYNCDRCAKAGDPGESGSSRCDIFEAIHDAAADDGTFPIEIADRMGYTANGGALYWRCPEIEA